MAKTLLDLDPDKIEEVGRELGTKTKKETIDAAMDYVLASKRRVGVMIDEVLATSLGVGTDIADPEVMKGARR